MSRGEEHGWVKGTCRYPQELLVKCRLKVLAWEGKESMQLSADDISASHNVVLRRAPIVFLGPEHTRFPLRSLRRGAEQAQKKKRGTTRGTNVEQNTPEQRRKRTIGV